MVSGILAVLILADERLSLLTKLLAMSVVALALLVLALLVLRRLFRKFRADAQGSAGQRATSAGSESAFAMAAYHGVIEKLRDQEKELERLHRQERQRAHDSEQLSASIMQNMATGLVMLNAQGIITESNPAAKAVLGHQLLEGRSFREVFARTDVSGGPSPILEKLESCLATAQTYRRVTVTYRAPSGENKVLGVGMSPILSDGRVGGAICLFSDLTEITALQQQVRLKESLAALGEMSAGIAHEFKNSLATISGYAQLIRQEETVDGAHKLAGRVVAETQFLTQIVTDFLNFSRPMNLVACDVSIRELIENSFAEITSRGDFGGVTLELEGEFPIVTADQTLLRQCFANLLRNGCEAVAEAGRPGRLIVSGQVENSETGPVVRLRFADSGVGISRENLPKVFIPFFTTKNSGTGLGLALVHKIVVNHNGKVEVSSEKGAGTTFTVTLPLSTVAAAAVATP